jgi:hypothetical protein
MRKPKMVTVERGVLTGQGATKTEAKANLEGQIDWAIAEDKLHVERRFDWLIVIARDNQGWTSKMVDMTAPHGTEFGSSCGQGPALFGKVLMESRLHAGQNAWRHEKNDAEHIAATGLDAQKERELASWIRFQRAYKAEKDNGATDAEAFERAGRQ